MQRSYRPDELDRRDRYTRARQPIHIHPRERVVFNVGVEVQPASQSDRIGAGIPPPPRPVPSKDVVMLVRSHCVVGGGLLTGEAQGLLRFGAAGAELVEAAVGLVFRS